MSVAKVTVIKNTVVYSPYITYSRKKLYSQVSKAVALSTWSLMQVIEVCQIN